MNYLGIDPGISGGLARFVPGGELLVWDMPVHKIKVGTGMRSQISEAELVMLIRESGAQHVVVERVSSRPTDSAMTSFIFGQSYGLIRGIVTALNLPVTYVIPQIWQKMMRVSPGPDGSRQRATQLWPQHAPWFARKRDSGRAAAALIACFGAHTGVNQK